jgi:glycosyltransferase involved in cell wall biosynthesis
MPQSNQPNAGAAALSLDAVASASQHMGRYQDNRPEGTSDKSAGRTASSAGLESPAADRFASPLPPGSAQGRSPKVSILIPTYNYARYLPETIESVLEQDFEDYELIIVDDRSKDDTEAVLRRYAEKDQRIQYKINPVNLGLVGNWNYCLSLAKGEYIKFLFGDDKLADRQALKKMVRMLDDNQSAVLAISARNIIDEKSNVVEVGNHMGSDGLHLGLEVIVRCLETNANIVGEPSVVLLRKRDLTRGFNPQFLQLPDMEMWFHLLEKGNAVYTAEPLCSFRKHPLQQTEVNRVNQVGEREHLLLLSEYYMRPWLRSSSRRKLLFTQIYWLRRKRQFGEASMDLERRMRKSLGKGWYAWFWTLRKLGRPFTNLRRFYMKRVLRFSAR